MKRRYLHFPLLLLVVLASLLPFVSHSPSQNQSLLAPTPIRFNLPTHGPDPNEILALVNAERQQHGLVPLIPNAHLAAVAEKRAQDMQKHRYYAHKGSDGRYYNEMLRTNGASCENLDLQFTLEGNAYLQDWLNSPSHRKCLLNAEATQSGYAVARMDDVFANGQATTSYIVVAIHASDPEVALAK